ncbi:MAG: MotA/TolQ/ExbB proton channel family protein [Gammaproteobacteria bacterium]|nr:MotA/TolQ/ExbB proton channel family protein [Gammaproteobacteria bacterium]
MSFHSFDNPVVWSILALGFFCYQLLTYYIIRVHSGHYQLKDASWIGATEIFIGALPLLGLLGTISGLLDTFHAMSLGGALDQSGALSQGIADALWTTQLGLVVAIPAWLLLGHIKHLISKQGAVHAG